MNRQIDRHSRDSRDSMDCQALRAQLPALLPDLLLDPPAVPAVAAEHVDACPGCRDEVNRALLGQRAAMQLLDSWEAPAVSPYFHSRMTALLREEQARPPAGLWDRARTWLLLTNLQIKPLAGAAVLGLLLAMGGGAYLDLSQGQSSQTVPQASATVRDLQSLDENAQVFQQMNSLDSNDKDAAPASSL